MTNAATNLGRAISIIDVKFGRDWLHYESTDGGKGRDQRSPNHPVAIAWREAKELLAQVERGHSVSELPPRIAFLLELADDFESTRDLPHFNTAVRLRLKTNEFEKARYEMHVAALFKHPGQQVEFVPRSKHRRTPDLKVVLGDREVFVECTRKDSYMPGRDDDSAARQELREKILSLQRERGASLEVVVIVVGTLSERVSAQVLAEARRAIEAEAGSGAT